MIAKIKACPCCEGEAELVKILRRHFDFYAVICKECGIQTRACNNIEKPIEAWNTRKPIESIKSDLKANTDGYTESGEDFITIDKALGIVEEVQHE